MSLKFMENPFEKKLPTSALEGLVSPPAKQDSLSAGSKPLPSLFPSSLTTEGIRSSGIYQPVLAVNRSLVNIGTHLLNMGEFTYGEGKAAKFLEMAIPGQRAVNALAGKQIKKFSQDASRDARRYSAMDAQQYNVNSPVANAMLQGFESAATIAPFLVVGPAVGGSMASSVGTAAMFSRNTYKQTMETLEDLGILTDANREELSGIVTQHAAIEGMSEAVSNYLSLGAGRLLGKTFSGIRPKDLTREIVKRTLVKKGSAIGLATLGEFGEELATETGQAINEKLMFQRLFEGEIDMNKAWREVSDDWAQLALTTFFSTAMLQGILTGGNIDTSIFDKALLSDMMVEEAKKKGMDEKVAKARSERIASSLHQDVLSKVSEVLAQGYTKPEDIDILTEGGVADAHIFNIPLELRKTVLKEIKETGISETYLDWAQKQELMPEYVNEKYQKIRQTMLQIQEASAPRPDWFSDLFLNRMGYGQREAFLREQGMAEIEANAEVTKDADLAWNMWQAFAIARGQTGKDMADKLIAEGATGDTLFQVLGFHGSGAIFDKPNKAARLSGEGTMYEGAGFYATMRGPQEGGKGDPKRRARWYAESYAKPSQLLLDARKNLTSLLDNAGIKNLPGSMALRLIERTMRANELYEIQEIVESEINPRDWGLLPSEVTEFLTQNIFNKNEKDFTTRALYEISAFEGMERIKSSDSKIKNKLHILENWLGYDTLTRIRNRIDNFDFEFHNKEKPLSDFQKELEELYGDPIVREHIIIEGLDHLDNILSGEEVPVQGLPFGVVATPAQEALFKEEIEKTVDKFLREHRLDPTIDEGELSDSNTGWIWKDPNKYYLLPWNEKVPKEIVNAVRQRLGEIDRGDGVTAILSENAGLTGEKLYRQTESLLGSDHDTSAFLDSIGILGTIYQGEGGENLVIYDEEKVSVKGRELFQREEEPDTVREISQGHKGIEKFFTLVPRKNWPAVVSEMFPDLPDNALYVFRRASANQKAPEVYTDENFALRATFQSKGPKGIISEYGISGERLKQAAGWLLSLSEEAREQRMLEQEKDRDGYRPSRAYLYGERGDIENLLRGIISAPSAEAAQEIYRKALVQDTAMVLDSPEQGYTGAGVTDVVRRFEQEFDIASERLSEETELPTETEPGYFDLRRLADGLPDLKIQTLDPSVSKEAANFGVELDNRIYKIPGTDMFVLSEASVASILSPFGSRLNRLRVQKEDLQREAGNVIPLSQRFNSESDSILFQLEEAGYSFPLNVGSVRKIISELGQLTEKQKSQIWEYTALLENPKTPFEMRQHRGRFLSELTDAQFDKLSSMIALGKPRAMDLQRLLQQDLLSLSDMQGQKVVMKSVVDPTHKALHDQPDSAYSVFELLSVHQDGGDLIATVKNLETEKTKTSLLSSLVLWNENIFDTGARVYQRTQHGIKGRVKFTEDLSRAKITFSKNADIGTVIEEFFHLIYEQLPQGRKDTIQKAMGFAPGRQDSIPEWSRMQERAAKHFLRYMMEGVSPSLELDSVFSDIAAAMIPIYKSLRRQGGVNKSLRRSFDRMVATQEQILRARLTSNIPEPNWEALYAKYDLLYGDGAKQWEALKAKYSVEEIKAKLLSILEEAGYSPKLTSYAKARFEKAATYSQLRNARAQIRARHAKEEKQKALAFYKKARIRWNKAKRIKVIPLEVRQAMDTLHAGIINKKIGAKKREQVELFLNKQEFETEDTAIIGSILDLAKRLSGNAVGINEVSTETIQTLAAAMNFYAMFYRRLTATQKGEDIMSVGEKLDELRDLMASIPSNLKPLRGGHRRSSLPGDEKFRKAAFHLIKAESVILDIMGLEGTLFEEIFITNPDRALTRALEYKYAVQPILQNATKDINPQEVSAFMVRPGWTERVFGANLARMTGKRKRTKLLRINGDDGTFRMVTPAEAISIFMHWQNVDAKKNLVEGGIVLPDADPADRKFLKPTTEQYEALFAQMPNSWKMVAQAFQQYFDVEYEAVSKEYYRLNKTHITKEQFYFTKIVDRQSAGENKELKTTIYDTNFLTRFRKLMESQGKFMDRMKGHHRPLVIGDAFMVVQASLESTYNYLERAETSRMMRAVLEDGDVEIEGVRRTGLKQLIIERFGDGVYSALVDYSRAFSEEMGPVNSFDSTFEALRRNYVAAKLGLNAWISLRQASSAALYLPETEASIWAKAIASPWSPEEMNAIDPQMKERNKSSGHRDLNENARSEKILENFIAEEKRGLVAELNPSIFMTAIRKMDQYAIGVAFRIAELEGLTGQALLERAHKLIRLTQPNYHFKDRSPIQRRTDVFSRSVTSFGSQRASLAAMTIRAIKKKDPKHFAKWLVAMGVNAVLLESVNSLRMAAKGDDWEDTFIARLLKAYVNSSIGAFFGADALVEILGNRVGLPSYPDVGQSMVLQELVKILQGGAALADPEAGKAEAFDTVVMGLLELRGLPVRNIKEIKEIILPNED